MPAFVDPSSTVTVSHDAREAPAAWAKAASTRSSGRGESRPVFGERRALAGGAAELDLEDQELFQKSRPVAGFDSARGGLRFGAGRRRASGIQTLRKPSGSGGPVPGRSARPRQSDRRTSGHLLGGEPRLADQVQPPGDGPPRAAELLGDLVVIVALHPAERDLAERVVVE